MKIFSSNLYTNLYPKLAQAPEKNINSFSQKSVEIGYYSMPSFKAHSVKYLKAKEYLNKETLFRVKSGTFDKVQDLFSYDLKKLDGIQEGIKVFKDMTMKEIAFIMTTLSEVVTKRGCFNNCAHCYADAKPPIKENEEYTSSMYWEDFLALTCGISELNKRLGFQSSGGYLNDKSRYLTPFHDADCSNVFIKDKLGKEHDFIEISEKLYDTLGVKIIFDTAGWNLSDIKSQKRMEKYIEYYSNFENLDIIDQFNFSLNPFHAIHKKEVDFRKQGKIELAQKYRDIYISRMANVFLTLTPLLKDDRLRLLICTLDDVDEYKGYTKEDLDEIIDESINKLRSLYKEDLATDKKYIKTKKEITSNLSKIRKKLDNLRYAILHEKARSSFDFNEEMIERSDKLINASINMLEKSNDLDTYRKNFVGLLDSNGKFYLTDFQISIPTELRLNFANDKKTAPIKPYLKEEFLVKKSIINNF